MGGVGVSSRVSAAPWSAGEAAEAGYCREAPVPSIESVRSCLCNSSTSGGGSPGSDIVPDSTRLCWEVPERNSATAASPVGAWRGKGLAWVSHARGHGGFHRCNSRRAVSPRPEGWLEVCRCWSCMAIML